jgi:chitinase
MKILLFVFSACFASLHDASDTPPPVDVVAYLPEWRYHSVNWDVVTKHVSHLVLFSLEMATTGQITSKDRLPSTANMMEAIAAARKHGTLVLVCFGGNGRSAGFGPVVASSAARRRFIGELLLLIEQWKLDGVDYNWEYPGYDFRSGYNEHTLHADYEGLRLLLQETRSEFDKYKSATGVRLHITMAYYPDGRQEALLVQYSAAAFADLLHMMTYDQSSGHHSSEDFAHRALLQGTAAMPAGQLTLGLPFYGRHARSGEWKTYEDVVGQYPSQYDLDVVEVAGAVWSFNGPSVIARKTSMAIAEGAAGVMVI